MNAPEAIAAPALTFSTLPPLGAALDGGIFCGLTTDKQGKHFAVALLPDKPDSDLPWKKAMAWADTVNGTLPTRPVAALLFANARDQFEPDWHWTSEQYSAGYAWLQYFLDGYQLFYDESYEGRARAVRLIHLNP
jgi:hypothetical protein